MPEMRKSDGHPIIDINVIGQSRLKRRCHADCPSYIMSDYRDARISLTPPLRFHFARPLGAPRSARFANAPLWAGAKTVVVAVLLICFAGKPLPYSHST